MALELEDWNVLDEIRDDEGWAFLLNDALDSGHSGYIGDTVANIEKARGLAASAEMDGYARLIRAAAAVGLRLTTAPRAA